MSALSPNKAKSTDLNKLNTGDLVQRLSGDKKEGQLDIKKLIQLKTAQAKKTAPGLPNASGVSSLNFNEIKINKGSQPDIPQVNSVPLSSPPNNIQISQPRQPIASPTSKPPLNNFSQPPTENNRIEEGDDDDDADDDGEGDNGDDDGDYEVDDPDDAPTKKIASPKAQSKGAGTITLQDDNKKNVPEPVVNTPKDVKLPSGIDLGLDKITNKAVLGAISDDEEDDNQKARKLYQGNSGPSGTTSASFPTGKVTSKKSSPAKVSTEKEDDDDGGDDDGGDDDGGDDDGGDDGGDDDGGDDDGGDDGGDDGEGAEGVPSIGLNGTGNKNSETGEEEENKSETILNLGGGDDSDDDAPDKPRKNTKKMTRQQLHTAKRKELVKIERLEKKGYKPSKQYTMADNYDDICDERERLEDEKGCEESIKTQRKILMGAATGLEYLNRRYDPFDIQLDGWSESVYENINDYDEVFEELYHKYKRKVKVAPEIKLLGMFAGSALMFHFSKTLFSKASDQVPGFDDVMKENPQLKQAYEQAALKKMNMNTNQPNNQMSSMIGNFFGNNMVGNMLGGLLNQPVNQGPPNMPTASKFQQPISQPHPHQTGIPQNVRPQQPPPQSQNPNMRPPQSTLPQNRPQPPQNSQSGQSSIQPPQSKIPSNIKLQQPMSQPSQQRPPQQHPPQQHPPQQHPPQQHPPQQPSQQPQSKTQSPKAQTGKTKIEMDGPSGVDDLLASLTKGTNADLTEMQLSDADTDGNLSEIGSNIKTINFVNKRTTRGDNRRKRL